MSIILAQKALQAVLRVGMLQLKKDVNSRNLFLKNFETFNANFRDFDKYAETYGVSLDNFIEPVQEIDTFIKKTEVNIKMGYPRLHADMPEICLVLGADGEGAGSLGGIAGESRDDFGNMKVKWNSDKHRTVSIHIVDTNPDALEILYQIIDFVLVTHRVLLTQMGLNNCHFEAGDIHPSQEGLASGVFLFERIISVTCDIFQEYESTFYGHSPLPSLVAMGSNLEDEPDVNPADLEEEVIVETTPTITEENGLYVIGDQIPVESTDSPLFRGTSIETTPTEAIVIGLAVQTFEQAIQGEFIFETIVDNSYLYHVYPKELGEVKFADTLENPVTFLRVDLIIDGADYYAYRSDATYTGTKILVITKI